MSNSDLKLDTRIDENAHSIFVGMGYDVEKLPNSLVNIYNSMKHKKDIVFPGRVTVEVCALIATLSDLVDKRGDFDEKHAAKKNGKVNE